MARPLRIEFPGVVYHLTSWGNALQEIYLADADRAAFLEVLAQAVARFHWLCHAYCRMGHPYPLLFETLQPTLSRGMHHLDGVYTHCRGSPGRGDRRGRSRARIYHEEDC